MKTHAIRLMPGDDLKIKIVQHVLENNILAGWIASCAGSLTKATIRFANQLIGTTVDGYFEIVSLSGTVSVNGCHIHISVADSTGKAIGGHLMQHCIVYTTAEIIIQESDEHIFTRENDGTTDWQELQIKPR